MSESKDKYLDARRKARHPVYTAKRKINEIASVEDNKENIFRVAKQMRIENQDVIGEKYGRGDDVNLSLDNISKKLA